MRTSRHTVDLDGRTLAWREAGAGWPVVLLHAFPLSSRMWDAQLARAPEGYRFIAPDLRGFGRSDLARAGSAAPAVSVEAYARDIAALMDGLEIDSAVIVGLSLGGYVAFEMYRQLSARFSGLVLADTRPQADTPEGRAGRLRLRRDLAAGGPSVVADQMIAMLLSDRSREEQPDLAADLKAMIEENETAGIDAGIGALMDRPDSTGDLPAISCATLILVGEHDTIAPPSVADTMRAAIPRATLVVLPRAGHLSNLEQPDVFSTALADFLVAHL
jgi:3-oxoadipate enol-lactonase